MTGVPGRAARAGLPARLDGAAFGIIYGAILVLSLLPPLGGEREDLVKTAIVLFGSVLAITAAKTFAEFVAHGLETGERLDRVALGRAWRHSGPTLAVANVPTALLLISGAGLLPYPLALGAAHGVCILLLATLGARVGWKIDGRLLPAVLGAVFAGGTGIALAALKIAIH